MGISSQYMVHVYEHEWSEMLLWLRWKVIEGALLDTGSFLQVWLDAECGLDYTVVRPAGLTNGAATDKEFKVAADTDM